MFVGFEDGRASMTCEDLEVGDAGLVWGSWIRTSTRPKFGSLIQEADDQKVIKRSQEYDYWNARERSCSELFKFDWQKTGTEG